MALYDIKCQECKNVQEILLKTNQPAPSYYCPVCKKSTLHKILPPITSKPIFK